MRKLSVEGTGFSSLGLDDKSDRRGSTGHQVYDFMTSVGKDELR